MEFLLEHVLACEEGIGAQLCHVVCHNALVARVVTRLVGCHLECMLGLPEPSLLGIPASLLQVGLLRGVHQAWLLALAWVLPFLQSCVRVLVAW